MGAAWSCRDEPTRLRVAALELLDQARQDSPDAAGATTATASRTPASAQATTLPAPTTVQSTVAPAPSSPGDMPPGAGTERQPFRVSWELLGRADGHVRGDGTLDAMPRTIELLGGTWIELSGYYAPAVIAPSTDELVLTLNRWDGCCIGLPPTPFDSALVKTRTPIDFSLQHQIRFGTLRGRLVLEPFALGGLVLGLYRIEDAELLR